MSFFSCKQLTKYCIPRSQTRIYSILDWWEKIFAIIILLIDDSDQGKVHSYEQIFYLSVKNCKTSFNIYLLYSTYSFKKTSICTTNNPYIHGKCIKYANNPEKLIFCQCDHEWSGRYCTIPHPCTCASDSLYLDISNNNRSICICPRNKFGSRCLLTNRICQMNDNSTCGQLIPNDDYLVSKKKVFVQSVLLKIDVK
jgi:hypothetical protein